MSSNKYRDGYEGEIERTKDEVPIEKFMKDIVRRPIEKLHDISADEDYKRGRDDARYGKEYGGDDSSSSSSSGCFITTACVEYAGLPDDCWELEMMRQLRDSYIRHLPGGKEFLDDYYRSAPIIVSALKAHPDHRKRFGELFVSAHDVAVLISSGDYHAAYTRCREKYESLKGELT